MASTEFEAVHAPLLEISAEVDYCTSLAHQQNAIPFIRSISVWNRSAVPVENVELEISADPAFIEQKRIRFQRIEPEATFSVPVVDVLPKYSFLAPLTEAVSGQITVEVFSNGTPVTKLSQSVRLLAYDEWGGVSGLGEILAAFSQPNHPVVEQILREASRLLSASGLAPSLEGYQSEDKQRVWEIGSAIYGAIAGQHIAYCIPPASFEKNGQKIRTPDRILANCLGTCMDLSMLFCSCLEQAGLRPIVLLKTGHAYAGFWLIEDQLPSAATDELQIVRKRAQLHDIVAFETTAVTGDTPANFQQAIDKANRYILDDATFELAVDIHRAREERILPLPSRTADGQIIEAMNPPDACATMVTHAPAIAVDQAVPHDTSSESSRRLEYWKRKLLDLSLRNRLLNFRPSKSTVSILCTNPAELENQLADGKKFKFRALSSVLNPNDPRNRTILQDRNQGDLLDEVTDRAFSNGEIFADLTEEELGARLTEIYRSARSAFEEGGANTLFLAVGFLLWKETAASARVFKAPLILVPVTLERKSVQQGFTLGIHDDESRVNSTLLEMLRNDFGLEVRGVDPLPTDESGIDVSLVWRRFARAIQDVKGWELTKEVADSE